MPEFSTPEELLDVNFAKPVYVLVDRLALSPGKSVATLDSRRDCIPRGRGDSPDSFRKPGEKGSGSFSATGLIARNAARNIRSPSLGFL